MRWDFWSLVPESLHQVMILYSDRGTPKSARFMHGYGSHTFSFINEANERFWVKFHMLSQQGTKNFTDAEANKVAGEDPDYSTRDLYTAIEEGNFPKWTMYVQIMPETEADSYDWHPFDLTKVWSHKDYPLLEVGEIELNRNPQNYFAEVEQAAFEPGNVVPGIGFSPDKMLQNRLISYKDAHHYRIGINYNQVPVNRPQCPVHTYHRDGDMRVDGNYGDAVNYEPNSFGGPAADRRFEEPTLKLSGDAARYNSYPCDDKDYYGQPKLLWNTLDEGARQRLIDNIVGSMDGIPEPIQRRQLYHFNKVAEAFGAGVAKGLGLEPGVAQAPDDIPSAAD